MTGMYVQYVCMYSSLTDDLQKFQGVQDLNCPSFLTFRNCGIELEFQSGWRPKPNKKIIIGKGVNISWKYVQKICLPVMVESFFVVWFLLSFAYI